MKQDTSFLGDERGSTLPIFALSLAAIIALVGATLALGMDSRAAGNLQATADSAALSGATAFINNASPKAADRLQDAERRARAIAESNSEYVLKDLSVDAITEDAYGQQTRVNVNMSFEPANAMAKVAGRNANVTINRQAVAEAVWGFPLCMLSLNESDSGIITAGDTVLSAANCVIWSNSTSVRAMDFNGGDVSAKDFCSAGRASISNTKVVPIPTNECESIPDPLRDWVPPSPSPIFTVEEDLALDDVDSALSFVSLIASIAVSEIERTTDATSQQQAVETAVFTMESAMPGLLDDEQRFTFGPGEGYTLEELLQIAGDLDNINPDSYEDDEYVNTPSLTISPGTYQGLDIAYGHIEMQPGVYHIVDAPLIVRRRATLTGEGVTIILHGEGATFSVLDEARLTLSAPADGPTAGFALAEDRYRTLKNPEQQISRLTGSGKVDAIGTVYLPRQGLKITGDGAADQASPLLQIVADRIDMSDKGALKIVFDTSKTDVPAAILPERTARLIH